MFRERTRREFLKTTGLTLAAATAAGADPAFLRGRTQGSGTPGADVQVWTTSGQQRLAPRSAMSWKAGSAAGDSIVINPSKKLQSILGFGGAFTDAACYMFNQLATGDREKLFHEMFHPSQLGLSVCRTCIGSSDYATKVYSFDEGDPDPDLTRFSIDHDKEYILPMLREARKANPDLFLFSSPWSPPGWMKANNSMLGGSMRRKYMASYAQYFVKFLQAYEAEGVPIQAVTIQNEVDTDQDGRMPACIWPQEYEADFVRNFLGPAFEKAGIQAKIWIIDHNYNLWGRAIGELETPGVRQYTNAIAWHGYVGQPEWIDRVHQVYPDVEMHWTEGGPDYTKPDYGTDWADWGQTFSGVLQNWCRSITAWNLALDEQGRPNIGPFPCGGVVTINSQTKAITYSGQYWALAHYSRFIQRGARRVASTSKTKDLFHAAFENPDGRHVVVVANPGRQRNCAVAVAAASATVALEPSSLTTLVW